MKTCLTILFALFFPLALATGALSDDFVQKKGLTLAVAKQVAAAAEKEACKKKCTISIAILDDGGNLIYFETTEANNQADSELAMKKARSSYVYQTPTQNFLDRLQKGEMRVLALPDAMPNPGGMPLLMDKTIIGAIGIGGGLDNGAAAIAGVNAFRAITGQPPLPIVEQSAAPAPAPQTAAK